MQFPPGTFPRGQFPYDLYATFDSKLSEESTMTVYYSASDELRARRIAERVQRAVAMLSKLIYSVKLTMDILLPTLTDWPLAPREEEDIAATPEEELLLPYWTSAVSPSCLVVPPTLDETWGAETPEKLAFLIYHQVVLAFLEADKRPWPELVPLWADEWQIKFAALWLSQRIDGVQGLVSKDVREEFEYAFEPEEDGKTPVTVRGFDWYDDTTSEEYMEYEMLLEQFAADLLASYSEEILPYFLIRYRQFREGWLSDEVTAMLASVLGEGGEAWLESLVYF